MSSGNIIRHTPRYENADLYKMFGVGYLQSRLPLSLSLYEKGVYYACTGKTGTLTTE